MKNPFVIVGVVVVVLVGAYFLLRAGNDEAAHDVIPEAPAVMEESHTPPAPQAKINIDVVCEDALAYMTFTDGASAEAFVAECKQGEHPEVVERFKADLNLDADVAI